VLATEHLLGLSGLDLVAERVEGAGEVGQHVFAATRPFEQHADVIDLRGQARAEFDVFSQAALALQGFLRVGLVVPETGRSDFLLELR